MRGWPPRLRTARAERAEALGPRVAGAMNPEVEGDVGSLPS